MQRQQSRYPTVAELRELLQDETGCATQHRGFPCNTCFHAMELNISDARLDKLWEAVLHFRGDYTLRELREYGSPLNPQEVRNRIEQLYYLLQQRHQGKHS